MTIILAKILLSAYYVPGTGLSPLPEEPHVILIVPHFLGARDTDMETGIGGFEVGRASPISQMGGSGWNWATLVLAVF